MKNRDLLIVSIFTLLTVILWMVFEVAHTTRKSTVAPVVEQQIKPIIPSFDTKAIQQLKDRQK